MSGSVDVALDGGVSGLIECLTRGVEWKELRFVCLKFTLFINLELVLVPSIGESLSLLGVNYLLVIGSYLPHIHSHSREMRDPLA